MNPRSGRILLGVLALWGLVSLAAAAQSSRAEQFERALAHVQAKEYDAALALFRELAQRNPRDYEARLWVARIEGWKGNYGEAERLYTQVLAETPGNTEAELGLADVLSWQGRHPEALARLQALYAREPTNLEVLLRLGKVSRWRGDNQAAERYYREALALQPDNREAQTALQILLDETNFRLELGYLFEEFDFASETHGPSLELLYTDNRRLTMIGRASFQRKFADNNTRIGLGLTRRFGGRTWLRGEANFTPRGLVLARQDYEVELTQGLGAGVAAGLAYRFLNFTGAEVHVLTPLLNWDVRKNLHLVLRYAPARTRFDSLPGGVWNHSGWIRLTWDLNRTWSPYLTFAVGAESFAGLSADQLGRFSAQAYGGGTTLKLDDQRALRLGYSYQNRTQGRRQHSLAVNFFQRF